MAWPLRIQYEDELYHVTRRGNESKMIVHNDVDHRRIVESLGSCGHGDGADNGSVCKHPVVAVTGNPVTGGGPEKAGESDRISPA